MNNRTLIVIAAAAVIALIAAITINQSRKPADTIAANAEYLVPALKDHINDVNKVVITAAESKPVVTIERGNDGWVVSNKGGYPADVPKLRKFLLALSDAKLLEPKTKASQKYAELGVDDVSAKDAKGLQIELDGLANPVTLIIGDINAHDNGTYVRRVDDPQSWLASGAIKLEHEGADWLERGLVDIAAGNIVGVDIDHADGGNVKLHKDSKNDATFTLAEVPKGREPGPSYALNGPATMLTSLHFDDVMPAVDAPVGEKPVKAHFVGYDGLVIDAVEWKANDKSFAQFTASVEAEQADRNITAEQAKTKAEWDVKQAADAQAKRNSDAADSAESSDEPGAKKSSNDKSNATKPNADSAAQDVAPLAVANPEKDHTIQRAALDRKVAELNTRFNGWTFELPKPKYEAIDKSLDDLLKPIEKDDSKAKTATRK